MKNSEEPSSATPRMSWKPRRAVRSANSGEPGTIAGSMISANTKKRIQAISIEGKRRREIFRGHVGGAEEQRRRQDQRDALERPVGARRCAAPGGLLLRQRQWRAVEPAAAAGGGVTANSRRKIRIRVRPIKTTIGAARQHPKTGCRYAVGCGAARRLVTHTVRGDTC